MIDDGVDYCDKCNWFRPDCKCHAIAEALRLTADGAAGPCASSPRNVGRTVTASDDTVELRRHRLDLDNAITAWADAIDAHPDCDDCQAGRGYTKPGPPHSKVHKGHCSCSECW
ncbi:MAG: hypothetical protein LC798_20160 [Chloroflexi bacterium]|nr:hypothetical protein [Chloroflexota bacterium]